MCRFSKQTHYIPVKKKIKPDQMARLFMSNIFKYRGMPQLIVSDRDPRMTSLFWRGLFGNMGTTLKFSLSFHPQTDGQSEEENSTILDLLKCYVSECKAKWKQYLPLVEYAYNNTMHSSIDKALFEMVEGGKKVPPILHTKDKIFEADKHVQDMDEMYKKTTGGAQRALALDGSSMGDRFLKVQPCAAKPKERVKKEVYVTPPTKTEGYKRAYIGNLSWSVTEEDIRDFFQGCKIDKVKFSEDKATGEFRGFGHVDFADDESLERAVKLDQEILLDRPLKVAYAVPSKNEKRATVTRDRKNITCHTCGEQGHVSSRCPYMGRG
ncbi:hypothetical protein L7F22_012138 [Adiantum nelumboides]|nr:hypothetical protein [Adiantum nelumboides]